MPVERERSISVTAVMVEMLLHISWFLTIGISDLTDVCCGMAGLQSCFCSPANPQCTEATRAGDPLPSDIGTRSLDRAPLAAGILISFREDLVFVALF